MLMLLLQVGWVDRVHVRVERDSVIVAATTSLPEGAVVTVRVAPVREQFDEEAGRLAPTQDGETPRSRRVAVRGGVIEQAFDAPRPGAHEVTIEFVAARQRAEVREAAGAGPFEPHRAVAIMGRPASQLDAVRRDAGRVSGWIRRAREALDGGRAADLKRVRELADDPSCLAEASSRRLLESIVVYLLGGRAHAPARGPEGADGQLVQSFQGVPEDAESPAETLRASLTECDELLRREVVLWHVKAARGIATPDDIERVATSFADIQATRDERESMAAALDAHRRSAEEPEALEEAVRALDALEAAVRAIPR